MYHDRIMKRSAFESVKPNLQVRTERELWHDELINRAEIPVSRLA